jgi:hypothetical protein
MKRLLQSKTWLATALTVALLGVLVETGPVKAYCKSDFFRYFEGLRAAGAQVNPLERALFSLLLTKIKPHGHKPSPSPNQAGKEL